MDYATPSARFARKAINQPEPMNFYAPPKNPDYSNSGVDNSGADSSGVIQQDTSPKYYAPKPDASRPGSTPAPGNESYAMPILNGLQNSQTPASTDFATQATSVAGNTLAGAASGALTGAAIGAAGGPIGAGAGALIGGGVSLVTSGLNAWLGAKQASAEKNRKAALLADALRVRQQEMAATEKWRQLNRIDSLEQAKFERQKYIDATNYQRMNDTAQKLQGLLSNNSALRQQWQKYGFN